MSSELAVRNEVVDPPNLAELAETIRREHDAVKVAALGLARHAVLAGSALIEAQKQVKRGEWERWLHANVPDVGWRTAHRYMRMAEFREIIEENEVKSVQAGMRLLSRMGLRRNANDHGPRWYFDDDLVAEIRARYAEGGVTQMQLAEEYGVSQGSVSKWTNEQSRQNNKAWQKRHRVRRRQEREALIRQQRDAAARKVGGGISDCYSRIRLAAEALDALSRDGANEEIRHGAHRAYLSVYRAEEAIVKLLGEA